MASRCAESFAFEASVSASCSLFWSSAFSLLIASNSLLSLFSLLTDLPKKKHFQKFSLNSNISFHNLRLTPSVNQPQDSAAQFASSCS